MFALCVSDIISVKSRVEEGKWVSLEAKDCYSFQCSGSLLSVYAVIEMFLNLCPALFFPFSLFPIPSVCSFHSLFLTLPSTPHSFSPLCCSISFVVFLLLPAEQRDSVTVVICVVIISCSSVAQHRWTGRRGTSSIMEERFFFIFQPNQKNVEMHVSFYLQEIGLMVWVTAGLWLCAWH